MCNQKMRTATITARGHAVRVENNKSRCGTSLWRPTAVCRVNMRTSISGLKANQCSALNEHNTNHNPSIARTQCQEPATDSASKATGPPSQVLGVDYGTSITGLALGRNGSCSPLKLSDVARHVLAVALEQGVEGIVVGIPVQPGGSLIKPDTDSPMGSRCRNLAHALALMGKEHDISVYLFNEKDTTRATMKTMGYNWTDRLSGQEKKTQKLDSETAAMLLRLYFGNRRLAVRINARVNIKRSEERPTSLQ